MTQELWIPGPMPGLNDVLESAKGAGGSGARYSKGKRLWTEHVWAHAKQAGLRPMSRIRLRFEWRENHQRRDPDNVAAAKKFVLDGLVQAGVIKGDGWAYVEGWEDAFLLVKQRPGVSVTLTEV